MGRRYDTICLLTDYGLVDEFVGVVKAVLADLAPHTSTIDLTHDVAPFDVRAGSLTLARASTYLPEGIVVAVVDPGVGTHRKGIAIEVAGGAGVFVGPDNGLLAPAVAIVGGAERVVELTNRAYQLDSPGPTFAGRDVFAPAAAHLANGVDLSELGPSLDPSLLIPGLVALPRLEGDELHAEVLWVDRFGNCQLNVGPDDVDALGTPISVGVTATDATTDQIVVHRVRTFADLGPGRIGAVVDSTGMIALAANQRSAASEIGLAAGDSVVIGRLDPHDRPASAPRATGVTLGRRSGTPPAGGHQ